MVDFLKKNIYFLGIGILIIGLLISCEKRDNLEDVKKETMSKVNEEISDTPIKDYIKGEIKLTNVESDKRESLTFYDFYLEAELSNEFNSLTEEEKHTLLKELDYIKLDGMFIGENSRCNVETFTFISGSDKYRVEPSYGFAIYKNDKYFDPESNVPITSDSPYTKEELEGDPTAPSTNPNDYNEDGEYVPAGGPSDNPADYNWNGEYKPVEDMTQEEIQAELEEMLERSLGQ